MVITEEGSPPGHFQVVARREQVLPRRTLELLPKIASVGRAILVSFGPPLKLRRHADFSLTRNSDPELVTFHQRVGGECSSINLQFYQREELLSRSLHGIFNSERGSRETVREVSVEPRY